MEVGADDRGSHLFPVGPTAVDCRSDPGEAGEPSSTQDGFLGNLAALDRIPPQLLCVGDQALRVEHVDLSDFGPDCGCVHVRVMAGGSHHRWALVAEHGWDHEPLSLADPGHADRQDVVLGLGEQPGAGGDVHTECQWLSTGDGILAVEGGGVALDGLAAHGALDVGPAGFGRPAVDGP